MGFPKVSAGYSGTPLDKKLGIKPGMTVLLHRAPLAFAAFVRRCDGVVKGGTAEGLDYVHLFAAKPADLAAVPRLARRIKPTGMLWISWYKKASPKFAGLTDLEVRRAGLRTGLVDIKGCAIDDDWSGLKFVVRLKDRR